MTVTFGTMGTVVEGTGNLTPAYPSPTSGQGLGCIVWWGEASNTAPTLPAGWTLLGNFNSGAGSYALDAGDRNVSLWSRDTLATGSEGTGTITVTANGSATNRALGAAIFSMNQTLGSLVWSAFAGADATSGTSYSATGTAGGVTAVNGDHIFAITCWVPDTATVSSPSFSWTGTGSGQTFRGGGANNSGHDLRQLCYSRDCTGTSSGDPTFSATMGAAGTGVTAFLVVHDEASVKSGAASGSIAWAGSATGATVKSGAATGAVAWVGSATGSAPAVGPNEGAATGSIGWSGSATGARTSAGAATGSVAYVGATTGARTSSGAPTGSITWTGAATGQRVPQGAAAGAVAWVGAATGEAPAEGVSAGSASGAIAWTGTATGARQSSGAATGAAVWTGTTTGQRVSAGAAIGSLAHVGAATGVRVPRGAAVGALELVGVATGSSASAQPDLNPIKRTIAALSARATARALRTTATGATPSTRATARKT